ncbi:GumC family protein [Gloeocapsopsis dulcis]|uniref:non-specific protein-tyrosine kinase n=1 Tax=Gloeocapsopsis dulcis AAB1 = 1H9 TaxID=1433147 RepID=A0A6N8G584_9CHRO|nr:polysaccharide biosynthesis tyrosine autokinase [Gloeocapsopsis dulcis]MUL39026.1 lipopolysaccharide biosynthesis protein [Gloeocapsopsis dulcis AAB1 = 1H9]WNN90565.1 polysaccharide biosynthesis tyrosine autokinase [Gloeocapsopsis dulcis]
MESNETIDIDLKRVWLILKRRWLPAAGVFGVVVAVATVLASMQRPVYEAQGKLLFKRADRTTAISGLKDINVGELEAIAAKANPLNTEIEIIRSVPFIEKTITALNLRNDSGALIKPQVLANRINARNVPLTDVLQISYQSEDPEEAAAIVNKVMNLYIENNIITNRAEASAAGEFIAKQLPQMEATVRQAEQALRQFKEQNQVVALDEEAKTAVAAIKQLENQITETQAQLADTTTRSATLQQQVGMNPQEGITLTSLNQSPGIQKVLTEYQQVEAELAVQQTRFIGDHPTILGLTERRDALRALLEERVQGAIGNAAATEVSPSNLQMGQLRQELTQNYVNSEIQRLGLSSRLSSLNNTYNAYRQRVNVLPRLEQTQRELERRLNAAQSTYETLLRRLQEVRVAENQNMGNARIIEFATVPENASIRKRAMILALGNVLALILAILTICILELSDRSVKTLREARERLDYTLLGTIPHFGKRYATRRNPEWSIPELPVINLPRSPISEAYRMLQANLKFLSSDKPLKVIVVTSAVPKEGKSTVSANLAAAMAQLGRKVLLIDADMRHPLQHHIWELTNSAGLSDVIVSQADFESVVTEVIPKLDVLSAGVIPPNPMALLDSKRMASLVQYFTDNYDFVIIDAPPLVLAADAVTLGKMTDGVLLVARPGVLDSSSAAAAKESLERSGQNVLGLVVNGVVPENESDSYFYYTKEYANEKNFPIEENAPITTPR